MCKHVLVFIHEHNLLACVVFQKGKTTKILTCISHLSSRLLLSKIICSCTWVNKSQEGIWGVAFFLTCSKLAECRSDGFIHAEAQAWGNYCTISLQNALCATALWNDCSFFSYGKVFDIPKTLKGVIKGVRGIVCEDKFRFLHYDNTAPFIWRTPVLTADWTLQRCFGQKGYLLL